MTKQVVPYNIGCEPECVPAETLLQDGWATFLLFRAVSQTVSASGYLDDLGIAVLECVGCAATKFGYPNDEGLPEHPLYNRGLGDAPTAVLEVIDSDWAQEVSEQMRLSTARIWGSTSPSRPLLRHFVVCLKELTFECLASQMAVKQYTKDFSAAFAYVQARFSEH
jgi:hypothetical protein